MPEFLVDTSVLLRSPELLAKARLGNTLLIPREVLDELGGPSARSARHARLLNLIEAAVARGSVKVIDAGRRTSASGGKGPSADVAIAIYMARARDRGEDLTLATEDRDLVRAAAAIGTPVTDAAGLAARLPTVDASNQQLLSRATALVRHQRWSLVLTVALSAAASLLANIAAARITRIIASINVWGTFILLLVLGVSLFWLRGRYRLGYGSVEFFIGFGAAARVFWPRFLYTELRASDILQVVAGLYVMVRGLDNVGKALNGTRWETAWHRVFRQ